MAAHVPKSLSNRSLRSEYWTLTATSLKYLNKQLMYLSNNIYINNFFTVNNNYVVVNGDVSYVT